MTNEEKDTPEQKTINITNLLENNKTQAAMEWIKDVACSDLIKDATAGAAVGAAIGTPVPIIGTATGAVIGAGVGVFKNVFYPSSNKKSYSNSSQKDVYDELLKLGELHQKGILSELEFKEQKEKLLKIMNKK